MADDAAARLAKAVQVIAAIPAAFMLPLDEARASLAAGMLAAHAEMLARAVGAALAFHERTPLYGRASTEDEPGACPHDPDSDLHFEADDGSGEWLCEGKPEGSVCSACTEDGMQVLWPCPEYAAIAKALGVREGDGAD